MNTEENVETANIDDMNSSGDQFLTFLLAGAEYGVDILRVQEIKGWDSATEIPNTPEYVQGVINLRGTIVPIIDLRTRFELERVEYDKTTVVIVLKVKSKDKERTMGFVVDAVSDVHNVNPGQLKDTPDFGGSVNAEFVKGLATVNEKMLILLDIDHLIDSNEIMEQTQTMH